MASGSAATAEVLLEEIAEAGATEIEFLTSRWGTASAGAVASVWIIPVGSELVEFFTFFGIAQDFVGLVDFFEFLLSGLFVGGDIRVVLAGKFAERFFDIGRAGVAGDSEGFVIVFKCGGHAEIKFS